MFAANISFSATPYLAHHDSTTASRSTCTGHPINIALYATSTTCQPSYDSTSATPFAISATPYVVPVGSAATVVETHYSTQAGCRTDSATDVGLTRYITRHGNAIAAPGHAGMIQQPIAESFAVACTSTLPTATSTSGGFLRTQIFATNDCSGVLSSYYDQQVGVCVVQPQITGPLWYSTGSFMYTVTTDASSGSASGSGNGDAVGTATTATYNRYLDSPTCTGTPTYAHKVGSSASAGGCEPSGDGSLLFTVVPSMHPISGMSSAFYHAVYNSQEGCLKSLTANLTRLFPVDANACDHDTVWGSGGAAVQSKFYRRQTLPSCTTPPPSPPSKAPTKPTPSTNRPPTPTKPGHVTAHLHQRGKSASSVRTHQVQLPYSLPPLS
jgi:hypothetical protein